MGRDARVSKLFRKRTQDPVIPTTIYDRFGREIGRGDVVHVLGKGDTFWRVVEVKPILDPGAPAGLVQLTCTTALIVGLPGGQRIPDLLKAQDATELEGAPGDEHEAPEPSEDPGGAPAPEIAEHPHPMDAPVLGPRRIEE